MKVVHDDYTLEGLADFRPVIWKILLENSRSAVQAVRRLNLKRPNCATKVRSFSLYSLCPLPRTFIVSLLAGKL